jgi:thiol-disulfide isomerase/thioredoxin
MAISRSDRISRRQILQAALLGGATPLPGFARSQTGPAFEVSTWSMATPPAFELADITGRTWRLADLKGRAALLNFWASWCEPCRAEMPTLQQLADLYGADKLLVLAINFKEPAARALQFAKKTGVTLPVLLDIDGKTAVRWGVKVFPTTLMIDNRGRARQRVMGEVDWTSAAAEKLISPLLKT